MKTTTKAIVLSAAMVSNMGLVRRIRLRPDQ
jgi:hypothetical protein